MNIRKLEPEDAQVAADLDQRCFSVPWSRQGFLDAISVSEHIFLGAFSAQNQLIGYCGMYTAADEGEITNVAVDPGFRGRGIAEQLVGMVVEKAIRKGVVQIYLEVRVTNLPAQAVYKKNGFRECGRRKDFYRLPDEDALVMCLKRGDR